MIKLLFNEDSDATVVGKIVLNGTFFSAEVHDPTFGYSGSDVIEGRLSLLCLLQEAQ